MEFYINKNIIETIWHKKYIYGDVNKSVLFKMMSIVIIKSSVYL